MYMSMYRACWASSLSIGKKKRIKILGLSCDESLKRTQDGNTTIRSLPCPTAARQTLFFYTHYTTGRTTDDDKCDPIRFTFLFFFSFFSNLFILFFLCVLFSFLSTSTDIYNTQLPGAFFFFFFFLLFLPYFRVLFAYSFEECEEEKITQKNVHLSLLQKDTSLRSYFLTFLIFLFSIIIWYPILPHFITSIDIDTCCMPTPNSFRFCSPFQKNVSRRRPLGLDFFFFFFQSVSHSRFCSTFLQKMLRFLSIHAVLHRLTIRYII